MILHSVLREAEEFEKERGEKGSINRETGVITIPPFTFLRCAIEGLAMEGKKLTKEELFTSLEEKFPWLRSEDGINYQVSYIYLLFSCEIPQKKRKCSL